MEKRRIYWTNNMTRDLLIERWNPTTISGIGSAYWENDLGQVHREGDQPAIVGIDGRMIWSKNGMFHRGKNKPAIIGACGSMSWYKNGELHRDGDGDEPAVVKSDGIMQWWKNGREYYPYKKTQRNE